MQHEHTAGWILSELAVVGGTVEQRVGFFDRKGSVIESKSNPGLSSRPKGDPYDGDRL